jgi:hypothetical protein
MGNPKGGRYERDLMDYLRSLKFDVERLRLAGKEDEGDLLIRHSLGGMRTVLEAKNRAGLDLAGWVREAAEERDNYARHRQIEASEVGFAVVHKRKGKGVAESYVTIPLHEYLEQIA